MMVDSESRVAGVSLIIVFWVFGVVVEAFVSKWVVIVWTMLMLVMLIVWGEVSKKL